MAEIETWKDYGNWFPTAYLRWGESGKLEQTWRRMYETRHAGGIVMGGHGMEEEWRDIPTVTNGDRE